VAPRAGAPPPASCAPPGARRRHAPALAPHPLARPLSPAGAPDFTGVYIGDDGSAGVGLGSAYAWLYEDTDPARAGAFKLSLGAAAPGAECAAGAGGATDYNVTYSRLGFRSDGGAAEAAAQLAPDASSSCEVGTVSAAEWAYTLDGPCEANAPRGAAARVDLGAASPFAFDAAAGCGALSDVAPPTPEAFAASFAPFSPAALAALPQLPNAGAPPFLRGYFVRDNHPSAAEVMLFTAAGAAFAYGNATEGPGSSLSVGVKSFLTYECLAPCERARARALERPQSAAASAARRPRPPHARRVPAPPRRQVPRNDGDGGRVHGRCAALPRRVRRAPRVRDPPR
jgi:hypothetical protein